MAKIVQNKTAPVSPKPVAVTPKEDAVKTTTVETKPARPKLTLLQRLGKDMRRIAAVLARKSKRAGRYEAPDAIAAINVAEASCIAAAIAFDALPADTKPKDRRFGGGAPHGKSAVVVGASVKVTDKALGQYKDLLDECDCSGTVEKISGKLATVMTTGGSKLFFPLRDLAVVKS